MNYKTLDLSTYIRKEHFERFLEIEHPIASTTVQLDITDWYHHIKSKGYPFFLSFLYAASRAANAVPEFRQRIRDRGIIEYDYCYPSYTVALPDGTYRFCLVNTDQPFETYLEEGKTKQERALHDTHLAEEQDPESLLWVTSTPWFSYTQCVLPYTDKNFSIPNLSWGKYKIEKKLALENGAVIEREEITLPFTIMINHALMDGMHVANYLSLLEEELKLMMQF